MDYCTVDKNYYKVWQVLIITEGPVVQSGTGCIITGWDGYYKVGQFYHRVGWVLKMGQLLQSRPEHNNFLRTKSQEDKLKYNKQQNFCKKFINRYLQLGVLGDCVYVCM